MQRLLYRCVLLAAAVLIAQPSAAQESAGTAAQAVHSGAADDWRHMEVGIAPSFARAVSLRRQHTTMSAPERRSPVRPLENNRNDRLLHTHFEDGTSLDYLIVSGPRRSSDPLWLSDLYALRESMQRSTTYDGPGVWVGIDPMDMRATVKLEIMKVINVLD